MREQLKNLTEKEYWVYGITERDFDHAVDLVREMIEARNEQLQNLKNRVQTESPDLAAEILDDVIYYRYTDNQYLWQFSLWRLQGLIEAVISHQLIGDNHNQSLIGLKSKLEKLKTLGYSIEENEIDELLIWAKLRNALSHAPPEQYRPAPLCEEDIIEYKQIVKGLYVRWQKQKDSKTIV